ncbi:helix-turn-helix domain-containing protein [Saccharothrix longispora]|uniref:Transcriptional regulator with XRE-family HTH domain n=1 Tax=Saccharothrix longispora TaxID=33920 RepID=A0ABU1PSF4_9PSEU|nr:helix-turn-helix transcriptional regulator [Saccharothrix longispora]MDR6593581.1 transcriptional regulator with XRE-family HTH domain [Saccharothrix longispora]
MPAAFWNHPDLRQAIDARDIGAVIRSYRTHPHHLEPIRQATAAAWIGLSPTRLSRIENGEPVNDLTKLVRWAHILRIPHHLLWFRMPDARPEESASGTRAVEPRKPAQDTIMLPVLINGTPVLLPLDRRVLLEAELDLPVPPDGDAMSPLSRRSMLTHGIAVTALPSTGFDETHRVADAVVDANRRPDGDVVEHLNRRIDTAMAQDRVAGARETMPTVLGIMNTIEVGARDVTPSARRELLAVGARGAELCGWLYRELHQPAAGYGWLDRGMEWAQEAGDTAMQGYLLLKKSQMAYDDRDASRVATLASAAADGPYALPAKVRAEVLQQQALGMAMTGEPLHAVERTLDQAEKVFDQSADEHRQDALGVYFTTHTLRLRHANCLAEAGSPTRASDLYARILADTRLPKRNAALHRARWALTLARSGEPDEAATLALEAVHAAKATASRRTLRTIGEVATALKPWKARTAVRDLGNALRD